MEGFLVYWVLGWTLSPTLREVGLDVSAKDKWHPKTTLPSIRLVLAKVTYGSARFVAVLGSMQTM